jgi:nucleoside-diphosphate-sugar epimerase
VKVMQLDMNRLKKTGWSPNYSSSEAVRQTARSMINGFV